MVAIGTELSLLFEQNKTFKTDYDIAKEQFDADS